MIYVSNLLWSLVWDAFYMSKQHHLSNCKNGDAVYDFVGSFLLIIPLLAGSASAVCELSKLHASNLHENIRCYQWNKTHIHLKQVRGIFYFKIEPKDEYPWIFHPVRTL